jgi:hypothetical protein
LFLLNGAPLLWLHLCAVLLWDDYTWSAARSDAYNL